MHVCPWYSKPAAVAASQEPKGTVLDAHSTSSFPRPQVFCVHSEPNYSLPWQRKRQFSSTGSGFLLPDRRILTNAHCVDHHSQAWPCSIWLNLQPLACVSWQTANSIDVCQA